MLRDLDNYALSTLDPAKPVFHWSALLTGAAYLPGIDLDFASRSYYGTRIIIESKPIGVTVSRAQTEALEEWARDPSTVVILVGTRAGEPDLFSDNEGVAACWVEIDAAGAWRDRRSVTWGTPADFRAFVADLKRAIRVRATPANEAAFAQPAKNI